MEKETKPKFNMELHPVDAENLKKIVTFFNESQTGSMRRALRVVAMICDYMQKGWEIQLVKKGERPKLVILP